MLTFVENASQKGSTAATVLQLKVETKSLQTFLNDDLYDNS